MSALDLLSLIITVVSVASFSVVFTLLFGAYSKSVVQGYKDGKNDGALITELVKSKKSEKKEKKRAVKIIKKILSTALLIFVCVFFVLALINKISGNATLIGDKTLMVVASGSMSEKHKDNLYYLKDLDNQFPTYSIIVLEKVDSPEELQQYDVIAYVNDKGVNIIHRIVLIDGDKYVTRGDANAPSDTYSPSFNNVIGKYTGTYLPTIGIFILFFQSYSGIATIVAIIYCMIMMDNRSKAINVAKAEREQALTEALGLNEVTDIDGLSVEFVETLYLNKFIYTFTPDGFVTEKTREEVLSANPPPDKKE